MEQVQPATVPSVNHDFEWGVESNPVAAGDKKRLSTGGGSSSQHGSESNFSTGASTGDSKVCRCCEDSVA
eukprot:11503512-Heterocapsa_arctica.AAC.1